MKNRTSTSDPLFGQTQLFEQRGRPTPKPYTQKKSTGVNQHIIYTAKNRSALLLTLQGATSTLWPCVASSQHLDTLRQPLGSSRIGYSLLSLRFSPCNGGSVKFHPATSYSGIFLRGKIALEKTSLQNVPQATNSNQRRGCLLLGENAPSINHPCDHVFRRAPQAWDTLFS